MIEITMYNIRKHFGDNFILNDASFTVYEGEKVGIVGANGSGKSTILKLLAGIEVMDVDYRKICEGRGRILIPKGTSVAYLEQLPSYSGSLTVKEILNLAFRELDSLEEKLRALEWDMANLKEESLEIALKVYSELQQKFDAKGGYERDEKLRKVCLGLKFDDAFLNKAYDKLSGGEKTSVNLGKVLLESHDVLLLDEPSNHLDMESTEWLENYLKSYKGIVILVSHDRYFLDNVVTKIVEVENKQCETYKGNYSGYLKQKEENMLQQFESYKEQKKKINSMESAIKDLRDWAQRADNNKFFRRAVSMQKKLDKMERVDRPVLEKRNIKINFKGNERSGNEVIKVSSVSKSFGDRVIIKNVDLYVAFGERVALIGPNGCGKSTFLKMLLGEADPDDGQLILGANVKIAYLPQHITFNNENETVIECFRENRYILEGKAREYLSKFMFYGKDAFKKVKNLSGGEKVRLKLSMLLYDEINLLILDEPTNHLDIDSIETLEEALEDFKGTILFISHDRYFINKVGSRVVAIENNGFVNYPGNYDNYRRIKSEQCMPVEQPKSTKHIRAKGTRENGENGKREIDLAQLESDIKLIEDELAKMDQRMSLPGIDHTGLNELYCKKEELSGRLDQMMERWLNAVNHV